MEMRDGLGDAGELYSITVGPSLIWHDDDHVLSHPPSTSTSTELGSVP